MVGLKKYLDKWQSKTKKNFSSLFTTLTFPEFLKLTTKEPEKIIRTSYQYIYQAILSYGVENIIDCGEKIKSYNLFNDPFFEGNHTIYGVKDSLDKFVDEIRASAMEEGQERIILIHGPPGTAKTELLDLVSEGVKEYSKTEEGALYKFSWVFKNDIMIKQDKSIGFLTESSPKLKKEYSKKLVVPCLLNENPLHLIANKEERKEFLEDIVHKKNSLEFIPKKILEGNLCYNCNQIYEKLLKEYNGDLKKVFNHVQVERFSLDYNKGLVVVNSVKNPESYQKLQIFVNKLAEVFPDIDFLHLHDMWLSSNRGMVHLSDVFKNFQNFSTMNDISEKHRVNKGNTKIDLDTAIFMTSNPEEHADIERHRYSQALMQRITKLDMNYLLNYKDEQKIYQRVLKNFGKRDKHIAPHTLEVASMWAVLTRLSKPIPREDSDLKEKQKEIILKLNPLQKMEIYSNKPNYQLELIPNNLKKEINDLFKKELKRSTNHFLKEGLEGVIEGSFGVSTREIQNIFKKILKGNSCLNPLVVFNEIERIFLEEKSKFPHLNKQMKMQELVSSSDCGDFYNSKELLQHAKFLYFHNITNEIKYTLLDHDEQQINQIVDLYIKQIYRSLKKEDGKYNGEIDFGVIDFIEKDLFKIGNDKINKFRQNNIFNHLNEYFYHNPNTKDKKPYRKAIPSFFKDIEKRLFLKRIDEEKIDLKKINEGLDFYKTKQYDSLDEKTKKYTENLLNGLKERYGYCDVCSLDISNFVLKNGLLTKDIDLEISEKDDFNEEMFNNLFDEIFGLLNGSYSL